MDRAVIYDYVRETYGTVPDQPFSDDFDSTVLRHRRSQKWYGLIMKIPRRKIELPQRDTGDVLSGKCGSDRIDVLHEKCGSDRIDVLHEECDSDMIDVLNVKCEPDMVAVLAHQEGFAPAYHMNKRHWLTVRLDGSVSREQIFHLLDISYELTGNKKRMQKQGSDRS